MDSPLLSLVVIRSADIQKSCRFYRALGFDFVLEKHGAGLEHYACDLGSVVIEIYPSNNPAVAQNIMLGFKVNSVQAIVYNVIEAGGRIVLQPVKTLRGIRTVVLDPDGYRLEFIEISDL